MAYRMSHGQPGIFLSSRSLERPLKLASRQPREEDSLGAPMEAPVASSCNDVGPSTGQELHLKVKTLQPATYEVTINAEVFRLITQSSPEKLQDFVVHSSHMGHLVSHLSVPKRGRFDHGTL